MTGKEMADAVVASVRKAIAEASAKWQARLEALEASVANIPAGRDGRDGKDGKIGERGTHGRDGINGKDGLGIDDLTAEHDGERGIVFRFSNGSRVKEFRFEIPAVLDKGFWKDGTEAHKGDGMTFGGSYWIAQAETKSKPEMGNADWRLACRKGRDGKPGDRGPQGEKGSTVPRLFP